MKRSKLYLLLVPFLFAACKTPPAAIRDEPVEDWAVTGEHTPEQDHGIHAEVSQEVYDSTLAEVQRFIDNLNKTISGKDYASWRNYLSEEYFEQISSPEFLANASESPALKSKKVVLRTPSDYFMNVVVPSRANSRVDEIDFETENFVRAYFLNTRTVRGEGNEVRTETRRLRVYELIKIDDNWKIVN
ncbi:MAG: hypothetical protein FWG46_04635 [Treponema sp.]|nr:hypothetical protein [Treponema sp.]